MIGAVENVTAPETARLCAQYLGPAARLLNFNNIPLPLNEYLRPAINPDRIIYTDPKLVPGGPGPGDAPEPPPTVSAYTGAGDIPPPPGWNGPPNTYRGIYTPGGNEAPSIPSPALIPNAPPLSDPHVVSNLPAQGSSIEGMLLPQTAAPGPPPDPNAPLLPAEGAPSP
jgi:phospholipid/cholesterol/gamma-HCH transport system substrate-binding protein